MWGTMNILNLFRRKEEEEEEIKPNYNLLPKRVLYVERDCPHCRCYLRTVQEINSRIDNPTKRIKVISLTDASNYGFHEPLLDHIDLPGTPYLLLDGIEAIGMTTPTFARVFMHTLVKEDMR